METNDERRVYELGYHMVSTLTEDDLHKEVDALRESISKLGGNFLMEGEPALMELAYTMYIGEGGKNTPYDKAYFGWIKFDLDPSKLTHLEKEVLAHSKNILRHLLIKTVAEDTRADIKPEQLTEVKSNETLAPAPKAQKPAEDAKDKVEKTDDEKKEAAKSLDDTIDKLLEE